MQNFIFSTWLQLNFALSWHWWYAYSISSAFLLRFKSYLHPLTYVRNERDIYCFIFGIRFKFVSTLLWVNWFLWSWLSNLKPWAVTESSYNLLSKGSWSWYREKYSAYGIQIHFDQWWALLSDRHRCSSQVLRFWSGPCCYGESSWRHLSYTSIGS